MPFGIRKRNSHTGEGNLKNQFFYTQITTMTAVVSSEHPSCHVMSLRMQASYAIKLRRSMPR
jgi:hypothetical protein